MAVDEPAIADAVAAIGSVSGVVMDPTALVEDAILLADALADEREYLAAVASTVRALEHLTTGDVLSARLKYSFGAWRSYHYQHRVAQGAKADMRIVFSESNGQLAVLGFGMRDIPEDIYDRLASSRLGADGRHSDA